MRARDVAAGVLLVNVVPHAVVGLSGGRCMTPFRGEDSGPVANLVWAGLNLAVGAGLLATGPSVHGDRSAVDTRRRAVQLGTTLMTAFGAGYELRRTVLSRGRSA
ncbi:MAG: hypothetical protein IE926_03770 [Micrococcales bacterium]|nr:hypothetical protein [Micrococcales bacterium]